MKPIIEIKNISKKYKINHEKGGYVTLREELTKIFRNPFVFLRKKIKQATGIEKREEFWALKNINFEVTKGEVVGIIGKNGSGKSTLLKIISQITPPTTGEIKINGTVGSLLEVGTGFHPELTGRENIFLNGAIIGMKKRDIVEKFDEIVKFAGIEKFLDTPVKYYSSGMYVRLAFSVASQMQTDILIIDEVLAVGDIDFQRKCLGKMEDIAKNQGRTILFVSHNLSAVKKLCKRSFLLEKGKIITSGETEKVLDAYLSGRSFDINGFSDLLKNDLRKDSKEDSVFKFDKIEIKNSEDKISGHVKLYEPFNIIINGHNDKLCKDFSLAFDIKSSVGVTMFNSISDSCDLITTNIPGTKKFAIKFSENYLPPGTYTIGISANGKEVLDWIPNAISFSVDPISKDSKVLSDKFDGVITHPHKWVSLN